ncbi:ABC transporter substrate-binding protein [Paenibacillus sp. FSL H8-0548]|nr:ABC transporter substrate-binding protein [Paenibacillus sp. FSL H8-0548]
MKSKKRITVFVSLLLVIALALTGCGGNNTNEASNPQNASGDTGETALPENMKATIKVWDWDEAFLEYMIPEFNKVYPNIKVEYSIVNPTDYLQKLQSGIASGSDVPDVILGEMTYRGQLFDLGVLANLEEAPYNLNKDQLFDYLLPLLSNSKGELLALDQQITPGGLAYRRDLAKEYLGTDDPDELANILTDWNVFTQKGIEVKEKSGGKIAMMSGLGDAFRVLYGQTASEYITDNEIDLTSRVKGPLTTLFQMRDAGILGKLETDTPAWSASFAKGETIFYPLAPWGPKWTIAANDKDGSGRWGLVKAPGGGTTVGGTSISVYKDSKNKEAAWAYINFVYFSHEGTSKSFEKFGFPPGTKSFYENNELIEKGTEYDEFFGGQNIMKYFSENVVPEMKGQTQTKYESIVGNTFNMLYPLFTKDTTINADTALNKYITEVKNKVTGVTVK